jgi:hypothetical protein
MKNRFMLYLLLNWKEILPKGAGHRGDINAGGYHHRRKAHQIL